MTEVAIEELNARNPRGTENVWQTLRNYFREQGRQQGIDETIRELRELRDEANTNLMVGSEGHLIEAYNAGYDSALGEALRVVSCPQKAPKTLKK